MSSCPWWLISCSRNFHPHNVAAMALEHWCQENTWTPCYYKCGPGIWCYAHQRSVTDKNQNFSQCQMWQGCRISVILRLPDSSMQFGLESIKEGWHFVTCNPNAMSTNKDIIATETCIELHSMKLRLVISSYLDHFSIKWNYGNAINTSQSLFILWLWRSTLIIYWRKTFYF